MGKIWLTSDWHFFHNQLFLYKPRGFSSTEEMSKEIIKRHNEVVAPDDDVYCLGDCMLNDNDAGIYAIKQLKGNIHLIRGNHDTDTRMKLYNNCYNIVEITEGQFLNYNNYHFYLSHYPSITSNYDDDKPLKKKMVSLCGHSHTKDPFADFGKGMIFHVEQDTNNCYPWLIDDIIELLKQKTNSK